MGCSHGKTSAPTANDSSKKTLLAPTAAETEPLKGTPEGATAQTSEAPHDAAPGPQSSITFGESAEKQVDTFIEDGFIRRDGFIGVGEDLLVETMTVDEAKRKASAMPRCQGFTFTGGPTNDPVEIFFKSESDNTVGKFCKWTSYQKVVNDAGQCQGQFHESPTQYGEGHPPPAPLALEPNNSTTSKITETHTETHGSAAQSATGNTIEVAGSTIRESSTPQQGPSQSKLNEAESAKSPASPNSELTRSPPQKGPIQTKLNEAQSLKTMPPIERREKFCCC